MSRPLLVNYIPLTETSVKLSLRCDRCRLHICYVEPMEAAQMAASMPATVGIYCHKCERDLGLTETEIVRQMADDVVDWRVAYAAHN